MLKDRLKRSKEKKGSNPETINLIVIGSGLVLVTLLHYFTPTENHLYHDFYRRFYYLPIIYAAIRFGLRGGLVTAIITGVFYAPHLLFQWGWAESTGKVLEILMFNIVGGITGILVDGERRQRRMYRQTSEELGKSLNQLKEYQEHMQQADRLKAVGELSAGIAHEIRNPLSSIRGSVEILREDYLQEDPKYELMSILLKEVERMNKVVGDFLGFARPPRPEFFPCNISKVVDRTLQLVSSRISKKRIELQAQTSGTLLDIQADAQQLQQAFLNIILNAIQSMPDGGKLNIAVEKKDNCIQVEFKDTGEGILPEDQKRMFDPFFSTKDKGTGLGLAIVYKIIEAHNGTIEAKSELGKGSVFTIKLPISRRGLLNEKGDHISR